MVLEEIRTTLSRSLRDRDPRNTHCALPLSRTIRSNNTKLPRCRRSPDLQLNRVAFQFIVQGGSLNPEEFSCFFLVSAAFGEGLKDCVPLHVVERLHALSG